MAGSAVISLEGVPFEVTLSSTYDAGTNTSTVGVQVRGVGEMYSPASVSAVTTEFDSFEEGESVFFEVALSKPTPGVQTLTHAISGTTVPGDRKTPIFTNGVTLSGNTLTVPAGISTFTEIIRFIKDEVSESLKTLTLTVGGVGKTISIADNAVGGGSEVFDGTVIAAGTTFTIPPNTIYALPHPIIEEEGASIVFGEGSALVDAQTLRTNTTIETGVQANYIAPLLLENGVYLLLKPAASAALS